MTRHGVWVDHMDNGRYQVRWHGGEWRDRDGSYRVVRLLHHGQVDQRQYRPPTRKKKNVEQRAPAPTLWGVRS
jgi:hypothetical protein